MQTQSNFDDGGAHPLTFLCLYTLPTNFGTVPSLLELTITHNKGSYNQTGRVDAPGRPVSELAILSMITRSTNPTVVPRRGQNDSQQDCSGNDNSLVFDQL